MFSSILSIRESESQEQRVKTRALTAAFALRFLVGLNAGWVGPLIPMIAEKQSMSLVESGLIVSLNFLSCIIIVPFGQLLLSKFGEKLCMQFAAFFITIGFGFMTFMSGALMLWTGSLIAGLGFGINTVVGAVTVLKYADTPPAVALNRLLVLYGAGALLGPILAWSASTIPWSYHGAYGVGAAIAAVIYSLLAITPDIESPKNKTEAGSVVKNSTCKSTSRLVLSDRFVWCYAFLIAIYTGVESGAMTWLFTHLDQAVGIDRSLASVGMSLLWAGLTFGRFIAATLGRRMTVPRLTIFSMLAAAISISILVFVPNLFYGSLVVVALMGVGFGPIFPNILASATGRHPQGTSTITTLLYTTACIGGVIAPWLAGQLMEEIGIRMAMSIFVVLTVFLLLLYIGVERAADSSK